MQQQQQLQQHLDPEKMLHRQMHAFNWVRQDVLQMTLSEDTWENDQTIALLLDWLEQDAMHPDSQYFKLHLEPARHHVFRPFRRYRALKINSRHGPPIALLIEQIQGGIDEIRDKSPIRMMAAWRIQRAWRRAISNPNYLICQRRLLREFNEIA